MKWQAAIGVWLLTSIAFIALYMFGSGAPAGGQSRPA